jgi:hypothetical protein
VIISFNYFQSTEIIYGCKDFRYGVEYDIDGNPVVVVFLIDEMDIYRQTLDMEELGQLYQLTKTISSLNALRIWIKGYFFVFIAS